MDNNIEDYNLLHAHPDKLLVRDDYQQVMKRVVYKFMKRGFFKGFAVDDLQQELNVAFLTQKMAYIQKNYKPNDGLLISYFERAVYNKCIDISKLSIHQQENRKEALEGYMIKPQNANPESKLIFQEILEGEVNKLKDYLRMFTRTKFRLLLLLKLYARIVLDKNDLTSYCPKIQAKTLKDFLATYGVPYSNKKDKEVYNDVIPLFNACDQKKNTPDALRKWINDRTQELMKMLNEGGEREYDKEKLKNLIQMLPKSPFSGSTTSK
ncbi:hypothetical protein [uncultured Microscilla sp.]|uniref:hypothetical protein n=1 Tax=uncultured Microscilla sp. TaxID=432653 RepID=UPI00260B7DE4|nr:hypothetical protein [uncultured Microscilla sp.]